MKGKKKKGEGKFSSMRLSPHCSGDRKEEEKEKKKGGIPHGFKVLI